MQTAYSFLFSLGFKLLSFNLKTESRHLNIIYALRAAAG